MSDGQEHFQANIRHDQLGHKRFWGHLQALQGSCQHLKYSSHGRPIICSPLNAPQSHNSKFLHDFFFFSLHLHRQSQILPVNQSVIYPFRKIDFVLLSDLRVMILPTSYHFQDQHAKTVDVGFVRDRKFLEYISGAMQPMVPLAAIMVTNNNQDLL